MTRESFKEILQNIHFADNSKSNKESDKGSKIRPLIDHFNKVFPEAMSDDSEQTIDEHMMVKFKGRSSMKQYLKKKLSGDLSSGSDAPVKRDICRKWTCTLERSSKLSTVWERE